GRRLIVVESGPRGRADLPALLRTLRDEGVKALLCEGGPTLHGALQAEGLVDEIFLTIAPKLSGGDTPRILEGLLPEIIDLDLAWLLEEDGELFARYRRRSWARRSNTVHHPGRGRGEEPMDFNPSPEVAKLRERVLDFIDEEIYPQEREIMEALDAEV